MIRKPAISLGCLAALVALLAGTPVYASDGCFVEMAHCFEEAALIESFWYRVFAALDCEVGFIICIRVAVLGL